MHTNYLSSLSRSSPFDEIVLGTLARKPSQCKFRHVSGLAGGTRIRRRRRMRLNEFPVRPVQSRPFPSRPVPSRNDTCHRGETDLGQFPTVNSVSNAVGVHGIYCFIG